MRKYKSELTKYLKQHWYSDCDGKNFKSTNVYPLCGKTLCHEKSGRTSFNQHVEKYHPVD